MVNEIKDKVVYMGGVTSDRVRGKDNIRKWYNIYT